MVEALSRLVSEKVLLVLTTSPAGLGHLRVMNALKRGLPFETNLEEVGIVDKEMQVVHRVTSVNPQLRSLMEFVQNNPMVEGGFTRIYRSILRRKPEAALHQLNDILKRQRPRPETVVILCTHFGLAHQLAMVKEELAKTMAVKVILAVVVTDDSPQLLWAVPGVDVEFVPSPTTRAQLMYYLEKITPKLPEVVVVPYPVDPRLNDGLSDKEWILREKQLTKDSVLPLKVMVPVSGAAVQLSFLKELLVALPHDGTVEPTVVARESSSTHEFLDWCQDDNQIKVMAHWFDRRVVEIYEQEMEQEVYGVEVTKPSEQAFKVLLSPKKRGGVIMLFSEPVGRQEEDNLMFMRRHNLLPSLEEQKQIQEWTVGSGQLDAKILDRARSWRGLMLPIEGGMAGRVIMQYRESGLLAAIASFSGYMPGHEELSGEGVKRIWEKLAERI